MGCTTHHVLLYLTCVGILSYGNPRLYLAELEGHHNNERQISIQRDDYEDKAPTLRRCIPEFESESESESESGNSSY